MDDDSVAQSTIRLQTALDHFINHVEDLKNEEDPSGDGFSREYREITELGIKAREEKQFPSEEGKKACNIRKNRYKDILPYDEFRVTLNALPGDEGSDYINASFIEDMEGQRVYIASQGPLKNTVYDFWRMILQYKVKVVAMACKVVEMGKRKCEEYWPEMIDGTIEFGDISVTMISEDVLGENCLIRQLNAQQEGFNPILVTQFHYVGWPDHGIPSNFDVILEMIAKMREIKERDADKAPMLIHCSAGCGRTGFICTIDYAWDVLHSGEHGRKV